MLHLHPFKRFTYLLAFATTFLFACDDNENTTPAGKYESGVLISNEGPFQTGTGTVSYYNRSSKTVENNIFETVNGRPLGNIVQSVSVHNGRAYAVVNNAAKVEVANAKDFTSVGVITGLVMPRYFLGINEQKAYVTQWGTGGMNGSVQVVDLKTNAVTKTIPTGLGAERLLNVNGKVFVVCRGGFGNDNRVTVINASTDEVITHIAVGDNPNSLQLDANNKLWVACGGKKVYGSNGPDPTQSTAGILVRIDPATNAVEAALPFTDATQSPEDLVINKEKNALFYRYGGKVYRHSIGATALSSTPVISRSFNELGIDPADGVLYAADAGDYASNGKVMCYNLATGSPIDSVQAGIIPGGFAFR